MKSSNTVLGRNPELSNLSESIDSNTTTNDKATKKEDAATTCDTKTEPLKKLPSYVPSYVRSVGFEPNIPKVYQTKKTKDISKHVSFSSEPKAKVIRRRYRHVSYNCESSNSNEDFEKLKQKYGRSSTKTTDLVHVKQAVAAMEARINGGNRENNPGPPVKSKPAKVVIRPKDPPEIAMHKEKHRRSMSDPNVMKKSVQEIRELWNQKADPKKQINLVECSARSGGSTSSLSSTSSSKSIDKKLPGNNDNEFLKKKEIPIAKTNSNPEHSKSSTNRPPLVSPRPKGHVLRPRAVTIGQVGLAENRNTLRANSEKDGESSPATENLSFIEKAKIFGGSKLKPNTNEKVRRHTNVPSPSTPVYRRSWSEDSMHQMTENSCSDTSYDTSYARVGNDSSLNLLLQKMKQREQKKLEEEKMVNDLQKNARLAKEKRRMRTSTGSSTISTPSDDEDKARGEYTFNGVRRRSKDVIKPTLKEPSPLAGLKTENSIFGSSLVETDNSRLVTDEAEFAGSRRISALHKLLEHKSSDPVIQSNSQSKTKAVLKTDSSPTTDSDQESAVTRPTKLALTGVRGRAGTENSIHIINSTQIEPLERCSSLENVSPPKSKGEVSPPTPDKRSSGFSEEEEDENKISFPTIVTTTPSVSSDVDFVENTKGESPSEALKVSDDLNSTNSHHKTTSSLTDMNLLEEYDKIAQQINEEQHEEKSETKEKPRPVSEDSSTMSVDSGYRNSMEEKRWSDFTENSCSDAEDVDDSSPRNSKVAGPTPGTPDKPVTVEVKLRNIANELLSTEKSYVAVLHLIDQVFHKQIQEAAVQKHIMPEQVVGKIFAHVPAIYSFHSSFLLPQLQERLANWDTNPCIGDIMTKAAPFLKMYSLYVQHFDEAMKLIKIWSEKSNGFNSLIQSIQKLPECNFLTLQHHMLGPVQRVPRYRLLLNDYVKRLPEDSADYEDATNALKLITVAATHSNETMKKIDNFHKLVNIFNNLTDVNFDIVDVSRELLKEGKIIKISARNGEKQERYLYLFSDMLLCCSTNRRLGKAKVTAKIDLDDMTINEILNPNLPFAFCVNGRQKSMEFATNVQEEKDKWMKAIQNAIEERKDRQRTFKSFISESNTVEDAVSPVQTPITPLGAMPPSSPLYTRQIPTVEIEDADLGTRAPRWIKDHEVTMCMCCSKGFNLLRRRHHCRACGRVICSECSENKATLQYDKSKQMKVCSRCYDVLAGRRPSDIGDSERKGVLEVEADAVSEKSAIASYLYFSENVKKKGWAKTWCVIPSDELCLYFYKAHQDVRAQMTLPLPGYEVAVVEFSEHKFSFRLSQARKNYYFACSDQLVADKWKYALHQGSRGYDLTKKQVDTLGQCESSSESDENQQDEEEIVEENSESKEITENNEKIAEGEDEEKDEEDENEEEKETEVQDDSETNEVLGEHEQDEISEEKDDNEDNTNDDNDVTEAPSESTANQDCEEADELSS